ncbi:hypothetical protein [Nocardia bovistercoris]|uniref:Uncharacterized protein n=1 Tax=Nocardia bovistercoris TaxID=2785916 RepID=A0A931N2D6_9NOCA|nr:hypothetical protein [Nocardia bovistercoris]MBH0779390.1 hypothetical protein [Nocardia bovistercoris]
MKVRVRRSAAKVVKPAPAAYSPPRLPWIDIWKSRLFGFPIPRSMLAVVLALYREQKYRIKIRRSADRYSYLEAEVVSGGRAAAHRFRDRGVATIGKLVDQAGELWQEGVVIGDAIGRLPREPLTGVRGELLTAEEADVRIASVSSRIERETNEGSIQHRRVSNSAKLLVPLITVLDLPILTLFSGTIFNVAWDQISSGGSIVPATSAIVFGLLGTVAIAAGLHVVARDVRAYKDRQGHISLPKGQAGLLPKILLIGSSVVAVGAGLLMGLRIVSDGMAADSGPVVAITLGCFFGLVVVLLNLIVFTLIYRDGSVLTEEVDRLTFQLSAVRRRELRLEQRRDELVARMALLVVRGSKVYGLTVAKMARPIDGAHQAVAIARSLHQGVSWNVEFLPVESTSFGLFAPGLDIDMVPLDKVMAQLQALACLTSADELRGGAASSTTDRADSTDQAISTVAA